MTVVSPEREKILQMKVTDFSEVALGKSSIINSQFYTDNMTLVINTIVVLKPWMSFLWHHFVQLSQQYW